MGSPSSRPRRSSSSRDREEIAQLLQDGAVFPDPSPALLDAAERLKALGIVTTTTRDFVACASPHDRDFSRVRDRTCQGRVVLDPRLDEDGNDYRCSSCGRTVFPRRHGKRVRKEMRTTVVPSGVQAHVLAVLAKLGGDVREVAAGLLRVDVENVTVHVCVVEHCDTTLHVSQAWVQVNPTCYVTVDPNHADDGFLATWTTKAALAEIVAGAVDLGRLVRGLAAAGPSRAPVMESPQVINRPVAPVPLVQPAAPTPVRRFAVEMGVSPKTVRVDGVEVMTSRAGVRFEIFRILWKAFLADLAAGTPSSNFKLLKVGEIARLLDERQNKGEEDEKTDDDTVRRYVNRIQVDIEAAVKAATGAAIGREDIVETVAQAHQADTDFGYRINPRTVWPRPFQAPAQ